MLERIVILACLVIPGSAVADVPDPPRQDRLLHLLTQDCGSCHGLTMKGGLGPALLPDRLRDRDDEDLAAIILDGIPGTAMPPWRFELTEDDATWLVRRLRKGPTW